jgi:Transcription factor WhiB
MPNENWKDEALCKGDDVNLFFEKYEEDIEVRKDIDSLCSICPVARTCFAIGVSQKAYGVWGGIYLDKGKISKEFNKHRAKQDWADTWQYLTTDREY